MIKLSPSILAADFIGLGKMISTLEEGGADYLHMDVMDGHFVPNISFGPVVVKSISNHSSLPLDVHLMISDPDSFIPDFVTERTEFITVHQEACIHLDRTLSLIRSLGVKCGVALNPATPPDTLEYVLEGLDQILVMSVNPGFGGQKFLPYALEKISTLAEVRSRHGLGFEIAVDGGLTLDNVKAVADAGANIMVMGSAITGADDPANVIKLCKEVCYADADK